MENGMNNTIVHRYGNKSVQKYLGITITVFLKCRIYVTNASNLLLLIQKLETIFLKNNYE